MSAGDGGRGPTSGAGLAHLKRTVGLVWRSSPAMVLGILTVTAVTSLAPAATVALVGEAVQAAAAAAAGEPDGASRATRAVVLIALVAGVGHLGTSVQGYLEAMVQARLANLVNVAIVEKASRLSLRHFEDSATYDRMTLARNEAGFRPYQLFSELVAMVTSAVTLIGVVVVLASWDPLVTLLLVLAPLPSVLALVVFGQRTWQVENARAEERRRGDYLRYLLTNDKAFKELRLLDLSDLFVSRFRSMLERFYVVDRRIEAGASISTGLTGLLGVAALAGAAWLAVTEVLASGEVGRLAGYLAAVGVVQSSTTSLFTRMGQLFEHQLFLGNLFGFLDEQEDAPSPGVLPFPRRLERGIEFRGVSFTYPGTSDAVLHDVSFTVPAGATAALVGENGAGKTTLVKLLARFYEPTAGVILVDGRPLADYDPESVRAGLGVLFQDYQQYEGPVRENVGFGELARLDDDEALLAALAAAGSTEKVLSLPGGLDAQLGRWFAGGSQLSTGQWQRIALARVLVRDAAVRVLDEPTAAIDAAAEAEIFRRLQELAQGATSLLIAHRFSTVRSADVIVVLSEGQVVEQGSHDSLMTRGGRYHHLFSLQAAGYASSPG